MATLMFAPTAATLKLRISASSLAVKDVVCGGVDRDVTEIDHRDILPARKKALELRADCPVAFLADSQVAGHGKPERQDFFFGEVHCAARNVQRQHLPGGGLRRGKDGALLQHLSSYPAL